MSAISVVLILMGFMLVDIAGDLSAGRTPRGLSFVLLVFGATVATIGLFY